MNFSNFFIKRPVFSLVVNLIIILIGLVSLKELNIKEFPDVSQSVIVIRTSFSGASAEIIEQQITIPLEEMFSSLSNLDYISSESSNDQSKVILNFLPKKNMQQAMLEVVSKMAKVKENFPPNLRDPSIEQYNTNNSSLLILTVSSTKHSSAEITDYLARFAKEPLEAIEGVASAQISGNSGSDSSAFQIHATIDPIKMKQYKVTISDIREAVYNSKLTRPLGSIIENKIAFSITLDQSAKTAKDYKKIIIRQFKNKLIRFEDIATFEVTKEDAKSLVRCNNKTAVTITIIPHQNINPIETSKNVKRKLDEIKKLLPKNFEFKIFSDSSKNIAESINSVYKSIFEAILFVFLILLLFLQSFKSTFIPIITIPISLLGGFFFIYIFGYTINTFTLLAMVLAVGLVVDDAIVVLENIHRYIEDGKSIEEAAIQGTQEIQFSVIAMTLTLCAVYIPIAFLSGMLGKLFIEFAVTLAGTVLISGLTALTLTPVLCVKFLTKEDHNHSYFPFKEKILNFLNKIDQNYEFLLKIALNYKFSTLFFSIIFAILGLALSQYKLNKTLIPHTDQSFIIMHLEPPYGANIDYIKSFAKKIEKSLENIPEIENQLLSLENNENKLYLVLKNPKKRKSCKIILDKINHTLKTAQSGIYTHGYCKESNISDGAENSNIVNISLQSQKPFEEMQKILYKIIDILKIYPHANLNTLRTTREPIKSYEVKIDEDKAARLNISIKDIADSLSLIMTSQPPLDRFTNNGKKYPMIIKVSDNFKSSPENLKLFHIRAMRSNTEENLYELVSLSEVLKIKEKKSQVAIARLEGMKSFSFSFETKNGISPFNVFLEVKDKIEKILPSGYKIAPSGQLRTILKENSNIILLFILALLFIFLIMAAQFESFIDPLIILFSVPLALSGGIIGLALTKGSLNLFTYISLITLIGLITKHGILIVDFANKLLENEKNTKENILKAIKQASLLRLRPILMTNLAMLLGAFPLALSSGAGYEIRSQIGWVILGGLSFGSFFTIFLIPCVYLIVKSLKTRSTSFF